MKIKRQTGVFQELVFEGMFKRHLFVSVKKFFSIVKNFIDLYLMSKNLFKVSKFLIFSSHFIIFLFFFYLSVNCMELHIYIIIFYIYFIIYTKAYERPNVWSNIGSQSKMLSCQCRAKVGPILGTSAINVGSSFGQ